MGNGGPPLLPSNYSSNYRPVQNLNYVAILVEQIHGEFSVVVCEVESACRLARIRPSSSPASANFNKGSNLIR
jgi:hypothetical protein